MKKLNPCSLFVTGTGYSGSGFALDWLREQSNAAVYPHRPFRYSSVNEKIYIEKLLCQIATAGTPPQQVHLKNVLICEMERVASAVPTAISARAVQSARMAKRKLVSLGPWGRARWNPELLSSPQKTSQMMVDLAKIYRIGEGLGWLQDIQELYRDKIWRYARNAKRPVNVVAIDKTVPETEELIEGLLQIAAPAKILLVVRNPFDQVADFLRCEVRSDENRVKFLNELDNNLNRRAMFNATLLHLATKKPESVKVVAFESLVKDHVRQFSRVAEWAGFMPFFGPYRRLDLQVSSRNIGLHFPDDKLPHKISIHKLMFDYNRARKAGAFD